MFTTVLKLALLTAHLFTAPQVPEASVLRLVHGEMTQAVDTLKRHKSLRSVEPGSSSHRSVDVIVHFNELVLCSNSKQRTFKVIFEVI